MLTGRAGFQITPGPAKLEPRGASASLPERGEDKQKDEEEEEEQNRGGLGGRRTRKVT